MTIRRLALGVLLAFGAAGMAGASTVGVSTVTVADPPYTQGGNIYQKIGGPGGGAGLWFAEWYSGADHVWTTTGEQVPQSDASIKNWLNQSPISITEPMVSVFSDPDLGGVKKADWVFNSPVNVIVLHYGNNMTTWKFDGPGIKTFGVDFLRGNIGMSDIHAYSTVPVPGAGVLFGSSILVVLGGLSWTRGRAKSLSC